MRTFIPLFLLLTVGCQEPVTYYVAAPVEAAAVGAAGIGAVFVAVAVAVTPSFFLCHHRCGTAMEHAVEVGVTGISPHWVAACENRCSVCTESMSRASKCALDASDAPGVHACLDAVECRWP